MARTIKELAELCKVSEQALRKWCVRNQVAKDVSQHYIIDETIEKAILKHYGVDIEKQVSQPEKPSFATDETTKELISMLKNELEAKNKQIEEKDKQIDKLQKALDQEQMLHMATKQELGQITEKKESVLEVIKAPEGSSAYDNLADEEIKKAEEETRSFMKPIRNMWEKLRKEL